MPGRIPAERPRTRSSWVGGVLLVLAAAAIPALARAQAALPAAPPIPSAVPALPVPSGLPSAAPALPSAAPANPFPPSKAGAPSAAPAPAPSASAAAGPSVPEDVDILLEGQQKPATDVDGVPSTLPRELQRNVGPGGRKGLNDKSGPLTLEEIENSPIVTATRSKQTAISAPAFVIVLSEKDIHDRGYTDLSQILDDLPGMDVVRPYGSVYVKSYWRGYQQGVGADPYLLLLDGVVFNSLFFGDTQILATFPISEIHHVEIVYGPASAAFGPNATMGVINVITKDGSARLAKGETGSFLTSSVTYGGAQHNLSTFAASTESADATFSYLTKDLRLRVGMLLQNGSLDRGIGNNFEYTKSSYYADPHLWSPASLGTVSGAGSFGSIDKKYGLDARLNVGNTEFAGQFFQLATGLGTQYAGDRVQSASPWTTREISVYARHVANLSSSVSSTTFAQYRDSGVVAPSSVLVSTYGVANGGSLASTFGVSPSALGTAAAGGLSPAALFFSVQAPNSALVFEQDFSAKLARNLILDGDDLTLEAGLKYQHIRYSAGYAFTTATTYPVGSTAAPQSILSTGSPLTDGSNTIDADEVGVYLLGTYKFAQSQALHLGGRLDNPPLTSGVQPTVRGGYVGTFDALTVKALYGQAVYAPGPYDLLRSSAINSTLTAERSQTVEADGEYRLWKFALHGDVYYVDDTNPIIGGQNLGTRTMDGFDLGAHFLLPPIHAWAYYSRLLTTNQSVPGGGTAPIGDVAFDKVWAGVTFDRGPVTATVLGRWMGPRDTVSTNPVPRVPAYFTLDANLIFSHIFLEPLWASFRATNLLNTAYNQPGIGNAMSGNGQAVYVGNSYSGSQGLNNSLLPQPGRSLFVTLGLDM